MAASGHYNTFGIYLSQGDRLLLPVQAMLCTDLPLFLPYYT
jgi:hypothetical protein